MSETYQAVCVNPGEWPLTRQHEYTCVALPGGFVSVPGHETVYSADRFERIADQQATTSEPPGAAVSPAEGLAGTLAARGSRYGSFETNGKIAQELKAVMRDAPNWSSLTGAQAEALDMFASKISRLLTGDPDYADNWHDIAGYATLVEETLG